MKDDSPSSACVPALGLAGQVCTAVQQRATVVSQHAVAKNTYRMRLRCPEVARQIVPGQFFMLRAVDDADPLLGRPFALLDIALEDNLQGEPYALDFGYIVVGKFTGLLSTLVAGDELEIWGPLGNGFPVLQRGIPTLVPSPPSAGERARVRGPSASERHPHPHPLPHRNEGEGTGNDHLAIVAGGIGQTPFVAVVREALGRLRYGCPARDSGATPRRITVCYGARNRELLAGVDWFTDLGVEVRVSTDDGSVGHRGFVTDILKELLTSDDPPSRVFCCGPEPMMHAVARLTAAAGVPCWLSLETPMACGIGACFSCVARIRQDDGTWDYRRVCVEGPVFPADKVVFED